MYLDSNPAGEHWFSEFACDVKVMDLETGALRQVMPLDHYFGSALWSHWVAVNNYGHWGDSIILCDLEEGGIMDADGHIIPEGGGPDAGADGGN